jgi:hypothetical protein
MVKMSVGFLDDCEPLATDRARGSGRYSVEARDPISRNGLDWWLMEQQPGAHALAVRARRLQAEATAPRVKQYLGELIARCERLEKW